MLLSQKTRIRLDPIQSNIMGHLCYAAYKLWNVCNYERLHYQELGLKKAPDWYEQKASHKEDLWYRSLPSQTAQEVCGQLEKAWKSFYALKKSGKTENPRPPRFKNEKMSIVYIQNGIKLENAEGCVRLSLPSGLKHHLQEKYGITDKFLFLKNRVFRVDGLIKQIRFWPPEENGMAEVCVVYETDDVPLKAENGHYLSVDLGLHNLFTCYDSEGKCFLTGRRYLSITRYFDKEIARVQGQWAGIQRRAGIRYPKLSGHVRRLYRKKKNTVNDYLHKVTRAVVDYCLEQGITAVFVGDLKNIQKKDLGKKTNQKLHALPYRRICELLEYKLRKEGIRCALQEESYTSQCSPFSEEVGRKCAEKKNRVARGLYQDRDKVFHADAVGAYNIMRKALAVSGTGKKLPVSGLDHVNLLKVAV